MSGGIYMITGCAYEPTSHGDNAYGGQTIDLDRRSEEHFRKLRNDCHPNPVLQNYYNKYGEGYVKFVVVKYCDAGQLDAEEIGWIESNHTYIKDNPAAFNLTPGGDGGVTHSLEYAFYNKFTEETIFGDNVAGFCRMHPELNRDCMYKVFHGKQDEHKGWVRFNVDMMPCQE